MRVPLPNCLIHWLINKAIASPHKMAHIYGEDGSLYMERYPIIPFNCRWTFGIAVRLHIVRRSDMDKHLHDHPWWNISWLLYSECFEEVPVLAADTTYDQEPGATIYVHRRAGDIVFRKARARHKLHLTRERGIEQPMYSLFITGPWQQVWGFYTVIGKVPWRLYLASRDGAQPPADPDDRAMPTGKNYKGFGAT